MRGMFSRLLGFFVLAVIALAIWRANNGDLSQVVDTAWGLLNRGADVAIGLWDNIMGIANDTQPPQ